ncbi:hypothetical protein MHZ92_14445 [Sporosarcina sp. ACRSL]|uniref:hypothetical protein n=1 Tax=Sporosarcina sp. ACRSL TaxID=2918215 RepID=UPI001EF6EF97|nr:hypothetical protein [Sporosarcina sp. ACRSL]MCG7345336.1 hypothetical protein [Sporosarcina sp. ACRSL]
MRPPIGVMPRMIWDEKREDDLARAIERYIADRRQVPPEWITEYNELIEKGTIE